jgi:hypothetical protein
MIEEPIAEKWFFMKAYLKAKFIASFLFSVGPGFLKRLDFNAALPKAEKVSFGAESWRGRMTSTRVDIFSTVER